MDRGPRSLRCEKRVVRGPNQTEATFVDAAFARSLCRNRGLAIRRLVGPNGHFVQAHSIDNFASKKKSLVRPGAHRIRVPDVERNCASTCIGSSTRLLKSSKTPTNNIQAKSSRYPASPLGHVAVWLSDGDRCLP
jgi:hypothetical protein